MDVPKVVGDEIIVYSGRVFEIVRQPMKIGAKVVDFEIARRSPGVRLLVVRDGKILLVKNSALSMMGLITGCLVGRCLTVSRITRWRLTEGRIS